MPPKLAKIREDLLYFPDPSDDARQFVKDPIRHQFFKYNELQIEMMKALDGKRTFAEVAEYLNAQFDADVPPTAVDRFVTRLEKHLLLDVSSYTIEDDKTRKQIFAFLNKRGLALRVKARDGNTREGIEFEAATREIHEGDPCKAARHLANVLEINPNNERARAVLLATHQAFFKTKTESVSHAKLIHLFNPDPLLRVINKLIGRFVFSPIGVIAIVLLILSGIPSASSVFSQNAMTDGFGFFDFIVAFLVGEVVSFYHEMCHGLACKHYGGTVDDVGWMLMYGIMPANYCDTSDTYLFQSKRHKIIVQLAGAIGTVALLAVMFHVLAIVDPSFSLWTGIAWQAVYTLVSSIQNLMPLVKYDAYYALTDYLDIANLRERSFAWIKGWLSEKCLGIPSEEPEPTPREKRAFLIYGPLAAGYMVLFLYGFYVSFLLPLAIRYLGAFGAVFAGYFILNLIFRKILLNILRFGRLLWRERARVFTPKRSLAFAGVLGLLITGMVVPSPLYISAKMTVIPIAHEELRATETGMLVELKVREGDHVEKGQLLAVLRNDQLLRDQQIASQELAIAKSRVQIATQGARPEQVMLANARSAEVNVMSYVAEARLGDARRSQVLGANTAVNVDAARVAAGTANGAAQVRAAQSQLETAKVRHEDLAQLEAEARHWQQNADDLAVRVARLEIRSPLTGTVVTKSVEERVGKLAKVGDPLMEVYDTTVWRVRIDPDLGETLSGIAVGERVTLAAAGDPNNQLDTHIESILPAPDLTSTVRFFTPALVHDGWRSGMTGHARIYGPKRSVAYHLIVLPIVRLVNFELPKL